MLYTEADGVWIHLQGEKQKHYELKNAIAYDDWERLPGKQERYSLGISECIVTVTGAFPSGMEHVFHGINTGIWDTPSW